MKSGRFAETPIGDDGDSPLGDFIEDRSISSPVDTATGSEQRRSFLDLD